MRRKACFYLLVVCLVIVAYTWVVPGIKEAADHTARPRQAVPPEAQPSLRAFQTGSLSHEVRRDGQVVFVLEKGYLARFRSTTHDDHWLGTKRHPVHLGWSPGWSPAVEVTDVRVEAAGDGFDVRVAGRKPAWPGTRFVTTLTARSKGSDGPLRYVIRSELSSDEGAVLGTLLAQSGRSKVEFLDIWMEGIFWPERDGHDRVLYSHFVFEGPDGRVRRAPKLHVFPSRRKAAYETLKQSVTAECSFAVVDPEESGWRFRIKELSTEGTIGICWWTWDAHLYAHVPSITAAVAYEVEIEQVPVSEGRALLTQAVPIPYQDAAEYQVPVFDRGGVNTFRQLLSRSDQWTWEPHSRRCTLDTGVGFDDEQSVSIRSEGDGRTAWYTRALGGDYFDHRKLHGGYRVDAMVRTQDVDGGSRVGVLCYNGPETWLYEEPAPASAFSQPIRGTNDWTPVQVKFDATGFKRFKIVLEQAAGGQSWFDNVTLSSDPSAVGGFRETGVLDLRQGLPPGQPRQMNLRDFVVSRSGMAEDAESLVFAWKDCTARGRAMRLQPGQYRLHLTAKGTGCQEDPPVLRVAVGGIVSHELAVLPEARRDYFVRFELKGQQVIQPFLTFLNDGLCRERGEDVDKNIFVDSIALERLGG